MEMQMALLAQECGDNAVKTDVWSIVEIFF